MKKNFLKTFLFILSIAFVSCQKQPEASFIISDSTVDVGQTVSFANNSTFAESYLWDFGDGTSSTDQSPTHAYQTDGLFTITLKAFSGNGHKMDQSLAFVNVSLLPVAVPPVADFSWLPAMVYVGESIHFTDLSTNSPNSWTWNFDDGTNATAKNPDHTFTTIGSYDVELTATNDDGAGSVMHTINVVNEANPVAGNYNVTNLLLGVTTPYTDVITASTTQNGKVSVTRFGNYINCPLYFLVDGNTLEFPTQSLVCGNPPTWREFYGTGSISGNTITINYTETTDTLCVPGVETYIRQ